MTALDILLQIPVFDTIVVHLRWNTGVAALLTTCRALRTKMFSYYFQQRCFLIEHADKALLCTNPKVNSALFRRHVNTLSCSAHTLQSVLACEDLEDLHTLIVHDVSTIDKFLWPPALTHLCLIVLEYSELHLYRIPPTVTHLALLGEFDQMVNAEDLPLLLEEVSFGNRFTHSIANAVPANVNDVMCRSACLFQVDMRRFQSMICYDSKSRSCYGSNPFSVSYKKYRPWLFAIDINQALFGVHGR